MSVPEPPSSRLLDTGPKQFAALLAGPILLTAIMWTVNGLTGTAVGPGCGSVGVLLDVASRARVLNGLHRLAPFLPPFAVPHSACRSVPFSADLPNMTLAVTAGFAVSIYIVFNARLRHLPADLQENGLVSDQLELAKRLGLTRPRGLGRDQLVNVVLALGSLAGSATMYGWLYTHGPIFRDLAGTYTHMGSRDVTTELLRDNWWANHQHHPFNTAMGVLVGAIGLFFAVKQGIVFFRLGTFLNQWRRRHVPVAFVPRWIDTEYGWRPFAGLVNLGYLAAFDFLASFSAALYMLRSDNPGPSQWLSGVLGVIATAGVIANTVFLASLIFTIRKLFGESVAQERRRIKGLLRPPSPEAGPTHVPTQSSPNPYTPPPAARTGPAPLTDPRADTATLAQPTPTGGALPEDRLFLLTEALSLVSAPRYPIGGRVRRFVTFVPPLVAAAWTFGSQVFQAFGG